jgi:hypothetical protein|tara:strand:- start:210 stop:608 length:399 start_codon:yes stop_codon:yes gene_type:complete
MATNKRTYPNTYFTWYNDDNRVAILTEDTTATSGERTTEKYDTYQGDDVTNGLRITYHSKYETIDAQTEDLKTTGGLDSGLHPAVVCYIKGRMFEDAGDIQRAQYFRAMYDKMVKQYPLRKTGVRHLAVPRL